MKKFLLSSILATAFIAPAIAGSPVTPVYVNTEVVAASTSSPAWGGFYVGGMASISTATFERFFLPDRSFFADAKGTQFGGFAGYNIQRGNLVFGVEADYVNGRVAQIGVDYNAYNWFADVKGRVGYAFGDALIYVAAGGTWGQYDRDRHLEMHSGFNYGAGIDFLVTDRIFVGAQYVVRDVRLDLGKGAYRGAVVQSVEARVGIKF